eukprot:CAMPEP_0179271166 /NCGR_PEP_ID=MMETSP0797-20121207/31835_1 /TAXON_ID=47934 /ORGANISM="Dinophysis acuminata, Strain DAEP01" /LENGTH=378 /DNA_ID=CAMNT_0020979509 /DNA_START=54 /DNA_END=1186 /DNA_ORIENTATION=-
MAIDAATRACELAKSEGNTLYTADDLEGAIQKYTCALEHWGRAVDAVHQEGTLGVGQLVRYDGRGFGVVMSAFALFDEYFLKDLGTNQPIWVGEEGGVLRRFAGGDLQAVTQELLDLRAAVLQNLAAACLKREDFGEAVRWADGALLMNGRAPKALMRKGKGLLRLNQPGPASDVLASALEVTPGDAQLRRLLREAEQRRSPTWVCTTGCCGPWGIVCGGPVMPSVPQVVPPAVKASSEPPREAAAGPPEGAVDPGDPEDPEDREDRECSSCATSCSTGSRPSSPRGAPDAPEDAGARGGAPRPDEPPSEPSVPPRLAREAPLETAAPELQGTRAADSTTAEAARADGASVPGSAQAEGAGACCASQAAPGQEARLRR